MGMDITRGTGLPGDLTAIAVFLGALTYGIGWPVFMLTKQIRDGRWF